MTYQNEPIHIPWCCTLPPPSLIKIIEPPDKLDYVNDEPIDITGIKVQAFNDDETPWHDCYDYPDGIIPIDELTITPTTAYYDTNTKIYRKDGIVAIAITSTIPATGTYWDGYRSAIPIDYKEVGALGRHYEFLTTASSTTVVYFTQYNGVYYAATSNAPDGHTKVIAFEDGSGAYGAEGIAVWVFSQSNRFIQSHQQSLISIPTSTTDPSGVDFSGAIPDEDTNTITITWNYSGNSYSDTFVVSVGE